MSAAFPIALASAAILSGTSLLYATLGELIGERAGIVNLGLEGLMLIGASTGFAGAAVTANPYLGVAAAALAGVAANGLFSYVVITRHANQLAGPGYAEMYRLVGAAVERTRSEAALRFLSHVFWYTMEFGVVREDGELRADTGGTWSPLAPAGSGAVRSAGGRGRARRDQRRPSLAGGGVDMG